MAHGKPHANKPYPKACPLPETLQISSWLDLGDTNIHFLPAHLQSLQLRWHGVLITPRIAFAPETITVEEILGEQNVELRRVLLERMGYHTFMERCQAEVLDEDQDPGGQRQLLRVPPTMRSCHQAAAWVAGFENPDDYQPLIEM
jgi:hypothetical protein